MTAAQFRVMNAKFDTRIKEIERLLADSGRVSVLGPLITADDVLTKWEAMSTDHRRTVIDALVTVVLLPAGRGTRRFRPETVIVKPR
jgi:hypothetical protein